MKEFMGGKSIVKVFDEKTIQAKFKTIKMKRLDKTRIPAGNYCLTCSRQEGRVHRSDCTRKDNKTLSAF